jgi:hypothetical protein
MDRLKWLIVLALAAAVPAVSSGGKPPPPFGFPVPDAVDNQPGPKADRAVFELLDEEIDTLVPLLTNDGPVTTTCAREDRDVFAGVEALRVTPQQAFRSSMPGWNFKIVENPKNAGEYRHVRFAWKKIGGTGVMVQFYDPKNARWCRYHAGRNALNWQPSKQLTDTLPTEWEVVTRDLFKDFGAMTITGFALSTLDGTAALFDHVLLGRTVEDLDKATDAALGRAKPAQAPAGKERDDLWGDLVGGDRTKAAAALRAFLASAPDHVTFIGERLRNTPVDRELAGQIQKLLKELDADEFDVRDRATDELVRIGEPALEAVQALSGSAPNDEVRYRTHAILRKLRAGGAPVSTAGRMSRVVRVLERAGNADARSLLSKLAEGEFGTDIAPTAKAALARLKTK